MTRANARWDWAIDTGVLARKTTGELLQSLDEPGRLVLEAERNGTPEGSGDPYNRSPAEASNVRRQESELPRVVAVSVSPRHTLRKANQLMVRLVPGHGVEGDAHAGPTVKHRSRLVKTPGAPNLRQVHLVHSELHDELRGLGYSVGPGDMGENITTRGIDLLRLPTGTRLRLGETAVIELTGLRNPCKQLDSIGPGLMRATLARDAGGRLVRKAGVMSIVLVGGEVRPNDPIVIERPAGPLRALEPV